MYESKMHRSRAWAASATPAKRRFVSPLARLCLKSNRQKKVGKEV